MDVHPRLPAIAVSAMLVVLGSCGTADDRAGAPLATPSTTAPPATTAAPTTDPPTTTDAPTTTSSTLPGEPYEFAIAGTVAEVPGVAFDETFDLRTLPGDDQPVAASLPPLTQLVFTGRGREIARGTSTVPWVEVTADGVTGWISQWSLVYLGAPRDVTAQTVSAIGQLPVAATMLELGTIVTDAYPDAPPPPTIVLVAQPTPGSTSEVVYDVFPDEAFGDDAARGARLRVTGRQVPASDLPVTGLASSVVYELVRVEASSLCTRGVSDPSGVCV